jgi:hypothetical protein
MQISCEGLKHADWLGIASQWHGNDDFFAADIKTSCIGVDTSELIQSALPMCGCCRHCIAHERIRKGHASLITAKSSFISGVVCLTAGATSHDIVCDQEPGC